MGDAVHPTDVCGVWLAALWRCMFVEWLYALRLLSFMLTLSCSHVSAKLLWNPPPG